MFELDWAQIIVALIGVFGASGGFWSYVNNRHKASNATTMLIMGLSLDRIVETGNGFIERQHVTVDEYGDFRKYLYDPYKKLGGNGTADKIMFEVDKLPTRPTGTPQTAVTFQLQRGTPPT